MLIKNFGKNLLFRKTITSYETKSFVDIQLRTSSIKKLVSDSSTGLKNGTVYTSVLTIAGSARTISVSGSSASTIVGLVSSINTSLSGVATATFLGAVSGSGEQVIRIQTTGANDTLVVTSSGSLISSIIGDEAIEIEARYGTPVIGGGYAFLVTTTASPSNPVDIGFFAQATSSAGADIPVIRTYNQTTGEVVVRKASGNFVATDSILVGLNIFG